MSRTALRAAVAAAAAVPALVLAPQALAATDPPLSAPLRPAVYNPQQGPYGAAVTCAPNLLIPFFGGVAFNICWA